MRQSVRFSVVLKILFVEIVLDILFHLSGEERAKEAVEEIGDKDDGRHPLEVHHGDDDPDEDEGEFWKRTGGTPREPLEAWVLETAEHHPC